MKPGAGMRHVHGDTPLPRFMVDGIARPHEPADIGNGVMQHNVVARHFDGERLVKVSAARRVEREEVHVGPIDVRRPTLAERSFGSDLCCCQHLRRIVAWDVKVDLELGEPFPEVIERLRRHAHARTIRRAAAPRLDRTVTPRSDQNVTRSHPGQTKT
jgi:hypothetical protein